MALINKNTGRVWKQSSFCPWITIVRDDSGQSLSPFDRLRDTVTVQPSPAQPEVELAQEVAAPLADIQGAIRVLNAGWEQLAGAQNNATKRFAIIGLKNQIEVLGAAIADYEKTVT